MARQHNVNGVKIPFTAEEETAKDAEEAQAVIDRQAETDAEAQLAVDKASAVSKLEALGLSTNEIASLSK